jgi:large subunit ribosomal protein L25
MSETTTSTLAATLRTKSGKGPARQLRFKGLIPAVCYSKHDQPVHVAVNPDDLKKAIATPKKFNTVITLQIEGGGTRTVLFKDFERDPVDGQILHADFLDVRMDQEVVVPVPVVLVGRPAGAAEGGILQQVSRTLPVLCLPGNIPEKIEVDVSALNIAESLHVSEIKAPAGVKFKISGDPTIAVVAIPEKEEVAAVAAAPVLGADGKPAPAAADAKAAPEGGKAAPAAGGKAAPAAGKEAPKAAPKK